MSSVSDVSLSYFSQHITEAPSRLEDWSKESPTLDRTLKSIEVLFPLTSAFYYPWGTKITVLYRFALDALKASELASDDLSTTIQNTSFYQNINYLSSLASVSSLFVAKHYFPPIEITRSIALSLTRTYDLLRNPLYKDITKDKLDGWAHALIHELAHTAIHALNFYIYFYGSKGLVLFSHVLQCFMSGIDLGIQGAERSKLGVITYLALFALRVHSCMKAEDDYYAQFSS